MCIRDRPKTVEAKMELVPRPEPAGMAESNVISIPVPKASSCFFPAKDKPFLEKQLEAFGTGIEITLDVYKRQG